MNLKLGEHLRGLQGPILITGHTGFKGTWLSFLLEHLGISTIGYSLAPEKDSLYDRAKRTGEIPEIYADIRDIETFKKFLEVHKPSAIIHMAAQPLVLRSYKKPRETFDINVMGTVNVLNEAFAADFIKAVIVVTTDKVYRNDNSGRLFNETDPLEGKDPYSASKVGAEAAVSAWQQIQKISGGPKVVSVRAGNVIGGGDWAENRLIPDLVRGFISGAPAEIRNPRSSRPWQHVLDPLVGYLSTLEFVLDGGNITSINFAPKGESLTVAEVARIALECWGNGKKIKLTQAEVFDNYEASSLSLDASYANSLFNLIGHWSQEKSIYKSVVWWKNLIEKRSNAQECTHSDIEEFLSDLKKE
jgi:CDP-glucose 4,6-dehydratase